MRGRRVLQGAHNHIICHFMNAHGLLWLIRCFPEGRLFLVDPQPFTPCYSYKNGQMRVYQKWTLDIGHSVHEVSYPGLQYMYVRLYSRSEHWRVDSLSSIEPGPSSPSFHLNKIWAYVVGLGRGYILSTKSHTSVHVRKVLLI